MSENTSTLFVELSVDGGDTAELDEFTRQLAGEGNELNVEQVERVSEGSAPTLVGLLFEPLKSWVERKPSTPGKIRVRVGKRRAQIEYDPTRTSARDLEVQIKTLNKTVK